MDNQQTATTSDNQTTQTTTATQTIATAAPPPSWRDSLTDAQLKADPSIQSIQSIDDLTKSYIHAQRMVGADKVVVPTEKSTPEEVANFYKKLGRPETADKYNKPVITDEQKKAGATGLDEAGFKAFSEHAHKLGLTGKQFDESMKWYHNYEIQRYQAYQAQLKQEADAALTTLKNEWGNQYDVKANQAQTAIKAFGGEDLQKELEKLGIANHPTILKAFQEMGSRLINDIADGKHIVPTGLQTVESAKAEINKLQADTEFQKVLANSSHPNYKDYKTRWESLFDKAYPSAPKA